jgi:hypothetical protein
VILDKLGRFSDFRIEAVYHWIVNHIEFFPKLTDINEAIGATARDSELMQFPPEEQEDVTCQRCLCVGLLCQVVDPKGELLRELPYQHVDWKLERGEYSSIARCTCANSNKWPRKWPQAAL